MAKGNQVAPSTKFEQTLQASAQLPGVQINREAFLRRELKRYCTDEQINKITHLNAMKHYNFDPFAHRPKEKCTAKALRGESPDVDVVTRVGRLADDRDLEAWRQITNRAAAAKK